MFLDMLAQREDDGDHANDDGLVSVLTMSSSLRPMERETDQRDGKEVEEVAGVSLAQVGQRGRLGHARVDTPLPTRRG